MLLAAVCATLLSASAPLSGAEAAFEAAQYDKALPLIEQALASPLSEGERVRAYELLAFTRAAFSESAAAIDAFKRVLELSPAYDPGPSASPKVRGLFDEARRAVPRAADAPVVSAPVLVPEHPPLAPAEPPGPKPVYRRPWFWVVTSVAAVVIAGSITGVVLAHQPPQGSLGSAPLR